MDPALAKALNRRKNLIKELETLDKFIDLYGQLFGQEHVETAEVHLPVDILPDADEALAPRKRRGKPAEIADAAERAIRRAGRPLARGELVEALESEGIDIPSNDKPRYVGTVLWRNSKRFMNVEGRGYDLKEESTDPTPTDAGDLLG